MGKKKKKKSEQVVEPVWRTFNIPMPEALIPTYDFLQAELNKILSDDSLMEKVKTVPLDQQRGNYWRALREIIGDGFLKWGLGANAWYARMLHENIRRIMESGKERREVHDFLVKHDNEISEELWKDMHENKCYPKHGVVRNVQLEIANGQFTDIPKEAVFVLDFTAVSDTAIERKLDANRWMFRVDANTWIDMELSLPENVRKQATGKMAKPRFMRRKADGAYTGCVSYEILLDIQPDFEGIFGVDLGVVKPFSGCAVSGDGQVSTEYIVSKYTKQLLDKLGKIESSLSALLDKQARCEHLDRTLRYERRAEEIGRLRCKRRNLRTEINRFMALDIIYAALAEDCGKVHVERLSWLDARGGRWNHSEIQTELEMLADIYGLKVHKVNAAYSSVESPFTGEHGKERERDVVFGDGWTIDRDFLGDVNVAIRSVREGDKPRRVDESFKSRKPANPTRVRRPRKVRACRGSVGRVRKEIDYTEVLNGDADVVVFSAGVGGLPPARSIKVMVDTGNMASSSSVGKQQMST